MNFEKHRFEIWNPLQHPYKHNLSDFGYTNPAVPQVNTLEEAVNALFSILYPYTKPPVATVADLPLIGNSINDYRVVKDDGDGKAAGYRWDWLEGETEASWHKLYDMDWGESSVLSGFYEKTQDLYVSKKGYDDLDGSGVPRVGLLSGQNIYGGRTANTNLNLFANSGDGIGPNTGFIQFGDNVSPLIHDSIELGEAGRRFKNGFFQTSVTVGTLSIGSGTITNISGLVSLVDNNLTTTGVIESFANVVNNRTVMGLLASTPASPADGFASLYFKADGRLYRLSSTGVEKLVGTEIAATAVNRLLKTSVSDGSSLIETGISISDLDEMTGVVSATIGTLTLSENKITSSLANGDIEVVPNGSGFVKIPKLKFTTFSENALMVCDDTGAVVSRGASLNAINELSGLSKLDVDYLRLDGGSITVTGINEDLLLNPNGNGILRSSKSIGFTEDNTKDFGETAKRVRNIFMSGSISDGTDSITIATILSLRDALTGATAGDALFFDGTKWVASNPDSEIQHNEISGLDADDHTQYLLLQGRGGGQSVFGGVAASEDLIMDSTSHATKGYIKFGSTLAPLLDASYVAGWSGVDLGTPALRFRNIYTAGEFKGLRFENTTTATIPASSGRNVGRAVYCADTKKIMVDDGTKWVIAGGSKFLADINFNGSELSKDVDVSSTLLDARTCQVQLLDNQNDFERIYGTIKAIDATTIRISTNIPLPVGSYRIVVME